jgi:hypothetical protein
LGGTVVEHLTHNPEVEGSKPDSSNVIEKTSGKKLAIKGPVLHIQFVFCKKNIKKALSIPKLGIRKLTLEGLFVIS